MDPLLALIFLFFPMFSYLLMFFPFCACPSLHLNPFIPIIVFFSFLYVIHYLSFICVLRNDVEAVICVFERLLFLEDASHAHVSVRFSFLDLDTSLTVRAPRNHAKHS